MRIRGAKIEDAAAIARVHVESWKMTYAGIVPQDYLDSLNVADRAAQWERHVAGGAAAIFVAEDEGGVFGFAAGGRSLHPVADYSAELYAIYLLASHQGRRAGAALVEEIAGELWRRGFRKMVVWVLRENPACGFYRRLGGVQVGEQSIEIGGKALPEVAFGWADLRVLCGAESAA
jgi:GNAT superfamily N-acetyltransferase